MTIFEAGKFGLEKNDLTHPFEKIEGFLRLPAEMQTQLKKIPMEQISILLPTVKQKILALRETTEGTKEKTISATKKQETTLKLKIVDGKIINKNNAPFYAEQLAGIGENLNQFGIQNAAVQIETVDKKEPSGRIVIAKNTPPLSVNLTGTPDEIAQNTREVALQDAILSKLSGIFNGIPDKSFKKFNMKSLAAMLYLIDSRPIPAPPFKTPHFSLRAEKIFIALAKYSDFDFDKVFALFFDDSGKLHERKFTAWLKLNENELNKIDKINVANLRFDMVNFA
jgi:hypothetical protein